MERLQEEFEQLKIKHNQTFKTLKSYIESIDNYMKGGKTPQQMAVMKGYEKKLREIVNPPPVNQPTLDWLAQ